MNKGLILALAVIMFAGAAGLAYHLYHRGAVFQVRHGHHQSTWVNTAFDLEQGHIQYVYVIPDMMVTLIDLHLSKPTAENTAVRVAYERTALSTAANEHVREFGEADKNNGKTWGGDIERYLATRRHP
jgi:hypothetical protein